MTTFAPKDAASVLDVVRWAAAEEEALELVGNGSRRTFGRPVQTAHTLDLSGLSGIVAYEPEELVLTALPGTAMAEIAALLTSRGQQLAFEPPDYGPLLGGEPGRGTLGGTLATNLAGPRRLTAGAARDHFLGFSGVSGRGEAFKAGGKVVKNVTGYDLMKPMAGSFGTLCAFTEVTVKVLPAPECVRTLLVIGLDDATAIRAMAAAMKSPHEVSAAAHLCAGLSAGGVAGPVTALRLEGFEASVGPRAVALARLLAPFGELATLETDASRRLWAGLRDVEPFVGESGRMVWKLSVPPSEGAVTVSRIADRLDARAFYDWAGGLVWLSVAGAGDGDGGATIVRGAVREGHATLVRAPEPVRAAVPPFHPQPDALAALSARVKASFDPRGILNPGRMAAGR
jgi:glycolate oxidase FAD binding subunit